MKKVKKPFFIALTTLLIIIGVIYFTLIPVFNQKPKNLGGDLNFPSIQHNIDSNKKTVFIVANNDGTELFDLMAPFYLFNATQKANVYVVSEKKAPILLVNTLFILPHYTFSEIDSLRIIPDAIVIPNVSVYLKIPPKETIVNWIKKKISEKTIVLSVCDGSATAAATGLYDGLPLTTHATDFKTLKKRYPKPSWVKNISVTECENFYSTAGISNAVEGSLVVIKRIFGEQTMSKVLHKINYPHSTIQIEHKSKVVEIGAMIRIVSKVIFRKNYKIGVQLNDNVNEFELASILDTYTRTFPASLNTFSLNDKKITSRYGLTMYPTGNKSDKFNELHILDSDFPNGLMVESHGNIIQYDTSSNNYPIEICLKRIAQLYGDNFKNCVKLTLDYN